MFPVGEFGIVFAMNIAVIKTGGKQYLVKEGQVLSVEHISGKKTGDSVEFEALFMDTGSEATIGTPSLSKKVPATIIEMGKDDKKIVVKYKAKSRYHKKRGHRQPYARVKIDAV